MRRFIGVTFGVALVAAAVAAWGIAAPEGSTQGAADVARAAKKKPKLPPLPAAVKNRKRWNIGVKCDFPPFGYIDANEHNAGYDVEIAHWFARFAFGKATRVSFTCVTTASRIPTLTGGRVDIIIATVSYTHERDQTIDFSIPYYRSTGRLLVRKGQSLTLRQLGGKTVVTTPGSIYDRWITKCFSGTTLLRVDTPSSAVLAVKQNRADTFMFDDAFLIGAASSDPDVRLMRETFLRIPWGIGIRQGDRAMKRWVDARLRILKRRNTFAKILRNNVPRPLEAAYAANVPTPKRSFRYAPSDDAALACP